MYDTEIGALRQKLASRVRSDDCRQRRKDMDSRSLEYKIAPDVTVEPATANGVRAGEDNLQRRQCRKSLLFRNYASLKSRRHRGTGTPAIASVTWRQDIPSCRPSCCCTASARTRCTGAISSRVLRVGFA